MCKKKHETKCVESRGEDVNQYRRSILKQSVGLAVYVAPTLTLLTLSTTSRGDDFSNVPPPPGSTEVPEPLKEIME